MHDSNTAAETSASGRQDKFIRLAEAFFSVMLTAFAGVCCLAIAVIMFWAAPMLSSTFEDFDTGLPTLTIWFINYHVWLGGFSIGLFLILITKEFLVSDRSMKLTLNMAVILLAFILMFVTAIAMNLPLINLMQSVM